MPIRIVHREQSAEHVQQHMDVLFQNNPELATKETEPSMVAVMPNPLPNGHAPGIHPIFYEGRRVWPPFSDIGDMPTQALPVVPKPAQSTFAVPSEQYEEDPGATLPAIMPSGIRQP